MGKAEGGVKEGQGADLREVKKGNPYTDTREGRQRLDERERICDERMKKTVKWVRFFITNIERAFEGALCLENTKNVRSRCNFRRYSLQTLNDYFSHNIKLLNFNDCNYILQR